MVSNRYESGEDRDEQRKLTTLEIIEYLFNSAQFRQFIPNEHLPSLFNLLLVDSHEFGDYEKYLVRLCLFFTRMCYLTLSNDLILIIRSIVVTQNGIESAAGVLLQRFKDLLLILLLIFRHNLLFFRNDHIRHNLEPNIKAIR